VLDGVDPLLLEMLEQVEPNHGSEDDND
jgi:hypothetical protein